MRILQNPSPSDPRDLSHFDLLHSLQAEASRNIVLTAFPLRRLYFSCLSSTFLWPEQQAQFSLLINLVTLTMGL